MSIFGKLGTGISSCGIFGVDREKFDRENDIPSFVVRFACGIRTWSLIYRTAKRLLESEELKNHGPVILFEPE